MLKTEPVVLIFSLRKRIERDGDECLAFGAIIVAQSSGVVAATIYFSVDTTSAAGASRNF